MGALNETLTVDLQQALQIFEKARMQDIRDIRSVDTDLLLVMRNGQRIVWQGGALTVLQKPDLLLIFKDGTLRAEQLFKQIETIDINDPKGGDESFFYDAQGVHYTETVVSPTELGIEQRWVLI